MTKFAVATVKQALKLRELNGFGHSELRVSFDPTWARWVTHATTNAWELTDAGRMAMELREVLGPDRNLTVAGAKAILRDNGTRATRTRLMEDGLRKRSFVIGQESALTEDGERVKAILVKYRAEF